MPGRVYGSQNRLIWDGIRSAFGIRAAPSKAPEINAEVVTPVFDVGAGGFANPQAFTFDTGAVSIAAAPLFVIIETTGGFVFSRTIGNRPDINDSVKLIQCNVSLVNATVTPVQVHVEVVGTTAGGVTVQATDQVNPSIENLDVPVLKMGNQQSQMRITVFQGGAGDTAAIRGTVLWSPPGQELPAL